MGKETISDLNLEYFLSLFVYKKHGFRNGFSFPAYFRNTLYIYKFKLDKEAD